MKYVINRKSFMVEKISWLETKKPTWDQSFNKLMMSFHDRINEMIDDIKDRFNDKDDPDEVKKAYLEHFENAFDSLIEEVRNVNDDEDLYKLWNEFVLNLNLWKDSFNKMSEKLDNYNSIFKLGHELFDRITTYITKNISKEYYDGLKGELDDKRQNSIKFIEKVYEEIKSRFIDVDAEDVFSMTNLDEKGVEDISLDAGDEVRYYQSNEEENIAIISHNQEELKEPNNIRLVAKNDGTQFEIDKSKLIEIIPKHNTINQEVGDKLKKIKSDPERLDKLNDYLDKLVDADLNESKKGGKKKEKGAVNSISPYRVKLWMSNHQFKRINKKQIDTILRDVYKPVGHWKKYQYWGVMDLPWETSSWSVLNKLNTNFTAFALLINEINRSILKKKYNINPFIFDDKQFGSQKFYDEYYRMIKFFIQNKKELFLKLDKNSGNKILDIIISKIQETSKIGDDIENLVIAKLPELFKKIGIISNPKMSSGDGERQDMSGGIDISFDLNNESKSMQVKKCRTILKGYNNKYVITGTSISSHYNVDYITCVSQYNLVLFKYDRSKIELIKNGDLKFNESLLIKSIKLNK